MIPYAYIRKNDIPNSFLVNQAEIVKKKKDLLYWARER